MPARPVPDKFLVAFSFAGEQRDLVRSIAEAVENELGLGTVFYDDWFEHYIAGADADLKLQSIYGEKSELAVVCVSERYGGKPWTQTEHEAIRARLMRSRASGDPRERDAILPIRVGDGEVTGILFNTIAPDIRERTPAAAAQLIIARLRLLRPGIKTGARDAGAAPDWPEIAPELVWPMADHTGVREAFASLLTRAAPCRLLAIRGPSETGKSHITRQMLANAIRIPGLACGRFDFKGTADVGAEVEALVQHLDVPVPPMVGRLADRLSYVMNTLKQRAKPSLLVFDTYEAAGDAQEWIDKQLLLRLMRDSWLRVVIAGQTLPKAAGAIWESIARAPLLLMTPPAEEWFAFGQQHKPNLDLNFVRRAYDFCGGSASTLAALLGPAR
jgi:hypothetical protein